MKTAIYLRVSTEDQDISLQLREISSFLLLKGITSFETYQDIGFTGSNDLRPDFKRLLNDCKSGKVDFLVVWKLDRLFRSLKHLIGFLDDLKQHKVKFAASQDNVDLSTPAGELMANMLGSFAQFERSLISQRTKSGMAAKKALGEPMGRVSKIPEEIVNKVKNGYMLGKAASHMAWEYKISVRQVRYILKKANFPMYY